MNTTWPHGAIVYQIYPRSFQDTDGDGVGNIAGIIPHLDHIKSIGADTIWLSPFYPSPQADFGYDIADYCDVNPEYGTLEDFKVMLAAAHDKDIKVWVDLVPNHTSDEHDWFKQSRKSRDNAYADWYIWRDAKPDGSAPNNWLDVLAGGPTWEWSPEREQYYLHSFNVHQPDLNWTNPVVRSAMSDVMRFWLDLGVDGFRVDAIYWMAKDPEMRDDPLNPAHEPTRHDRYDSLLHKNSTAWPEVFDYLSAMADVLKEPAYRDRPRFMVTEAYPNTDDHLTEYGQFYVKVDPQFSAPFNFESFNIPFEAKAWRQFLSDFTNHITSINPVSVGSYAFGNHDQPRLASRLGDDLARAAAVMLYTLPGMSFVYNGDELGMTNGSIPPEFIHDPAANGGWGRDPARTPMQWDDSTNAGFTSAETPWLPVNDNASERNATAEQYEPRSFLSLYQRLGGLRRTHQCLQTGSFKLIDSIEGVLAYERTYKDDTVDVYINLSDQAVVLSNIAGVGQLGSTDDSVSLGEVRLAPYQAEVFIV